MILQPLKQWVCDKCGEVIKCPEDGYVQWNRKNSDLEIDDFVIVHHKPASPMKNSRKACYIYDSDCDLKSFLGEKGIVELHGLLDPGQYHMPEYKTRVTNIRNWSDFYKRLQLPYYEEARRYWNRAMNDGYFGDSNEIYIYLPENLKRMIEHYESEDNF
ncbi:hypothetical protein [Clostridium sp. FP1]|uniref:hypothetical protein n=1 Tax=Clostridium sp. FP1 TaxID=2724076 RepID=UPI0013E942B7|nr:hypothetical protein [Clostridium sp. FP1]MBZ9633058.1 hypothetical protein [Clostridium sp. FP1]